MVEKRAEELMMRNQALQISQTVLDALPIGVVGLDVDGIIVRTNRAAMSLMGLEDEFVVGNVYLETLPQQVCALMESFHDDSCRHGDVLLGDRELRFWLTRLRSGEQEGIVLGVADLSGNCPCRGDEKDDLGERLCLMSQS
ncbi:MAG: PAS domain-containing protein [Deltaproteobacteria bacterium]|nr:MAG: PAS domain-containing protein [Deltaproteobacteria bacterium]